MPRLDPEVLQDFAEMILFGAGVPMLDAQLVATLLVRADLLGYPAHGVAHLPAYIKRIKDGIVDLSIGPEVVQDAPAFAQIDGHFYLGQIVANQAMTLAIEKAQEQGVGVVTFTRAGHIGRLADYVELAADRGCVGMAMVSVSSASVPTHGGMSGVAGTNPIAFGIPGKDSRHFVLDFATAAMSRGELGRLMAAGEPIPEGVLIDSEGNPTTLAGQGQGRTTLIPFGEHKGAGLQLVAELLGGVFSAHGLGSAWQKAGPGGAINGGYFQAMRADLFRPLEEFLDEADALESAVRASQKRPGVSEIRVPGDRAREALGQNLQDGVEIDPQDWEALEACARDLGLEEPS